jgi:hypothetical protein
MDLAQRKAGDGGKVREDWALTSLYIVYSYASSEPIEDGVSRRNWAPFKPWKKFL